MDWYYRAVLTGAVVAVVLMAAQLFGRRAAGLVAGLPIITAPALLWVAAAHGDAFAARSAVGGIAACAMAALFAFAYERLSRRHGPALTLLASVAVAAVVAIPMQRLADAIAPAVLVVTLVCLVALMRLPATAPDTLAPPRLRGELLLTALAAGVVSAVAAICAPAFGPFWSGVLASLPVISASVLVHQHVTGTRAERQRFVRGYVSGLLGKVAFTATFALTAASWGSHVAVGPAVALGLVTALAVGRVLVRFDRRASRRLGRRDRVMA